MIFKKRNLGLGLLALGLVLVVGLVANAGMVKHSGGKGSCASSASMAGCTSAQKSSCTGAQMGAQAGGQMGSCCSAKGAKMTTTSAQAGPIFPEGTKVTRVEVPGGMDLIFTGRDLAAIQAVLNEHMAACGDSKGTAESCGGRTCSMTSTEGGIVFSVRGPNPQECCMGLMATSEQASGQMAPTCPHAAKGSMGQMKKS